MLDRKADVARWARGQRLASRRIAQEGRRTGVRLADDLAHLDDMRRFADALGATVSPSDAERENLAFHSAWMRVRRALGVG
jgi:hypothetical protein